MIATLGRRWGIAALALALGACAAQLDAHRHAALGAATLARATAEGTAERAWPVARWHAGRSGLCGGLGLALALLAVACWAVAFRVGQPAPHAVLVVILVAYVVLALLIV